MRGIVRVGAAAAALTGIACAAVISWRRHPRIGTRFVNSVVNPRLVSRGLAGYGASEIGTLEHVGRRSGTRRLTPVHPERTPEGFRIVVPLGPQSQWARNVLAAGHCRLQVHDHVYELDEPMMLPAAEANDLPWVVRRAMAALGFQYLHLHTLGSSAGTLEGSTSDASDGTTREANVAIVEGLPTELVSAAR